MQECESAKHGSGQHGMQRGGFQATPAPELAAPCLAVHVPCDRGAAETKACRVDAQHDGRRGRVPGTPDAAGAVEGRGEQGVGQGGVEVDERCGAGVACQHRHRKARAALGGLRGSTKRGETSGGQHKERQDKWSRLVGMLGGARGCVVGEAPLVARADHSMAQQARHPASACSLPRGCRHGEARQQHSILTPAPTPRPPQLPTRRHPRTPSCQTRTVPSMEEEAMRELSADTDRSVKASRAGGQGAGRRAR